MAYPACTPPKAQGVKPHTRAAPGRRRRRARKGHATTAGAYWTCARSGGGTCGVHHRSYLAAIRHSRRLNLQAYRAGRGRPWDPVKRGG